jgi:integrase
VARVRLAQLAAAELPPAARAAGVEDPRPYDLRHSFASLLIHEGRHSIVQIAEQLGHNPTTCLSTHAHVIAELQEAPRVPAEQEIFGLLVPAA